jgi:hypothetical protein
VGSFGTIVVRTAGHGLQQSGEEQMAKFAVVFDRIEYDQFIALMPGEPNIPSTYVQWLTRRAEERVVERASRQEVVEVPISLFEFTDYCRVQAVTPSYNALIGAAMKKYGTS